MTSKPRASGLAVVVDRQGRIVDTMYGATDLVAREVARFSDLLFVASRTKGDAFLQAVSDLGVACPWELTPLETAPKRAFQFAGVAVGKESIVLAAPTLSSLESLVQHLLSAGRLTPPQRQSVQMLQERLRSFDCPERSIFEELSRTTAELAQMHRELVRKNAELERAMQAKTELLGIASHDLRNPLSGISAASDVLESIDEDRSPLQRELLSGIRSSATSMLRIVDDFLGREVTESGKFALTTAPLDISLVVQEVIRSTERFAKEKDIRVRFVSPCDLPPITGDEPKLQQVVSNLLTNAIKFSHPGREIIVSCAREDTGVRVSIADEGVGLSAQEANTLFTGPVESRSGTSGEKGHGFGLLLARKVIEAHGGIISVKSEPGRGACFSIQLPVESGPSASKEGSRELSIATEPSNRARVS